MLELTDEERRSFHIMQDILSTRTGIYFNPDYSLRPPITQQTLDVMRHICEEMIAIHEKQLPHYERVINAARRQPAVKSEMQRGFI